MHFIVPVLHEQDHVVAAMTWFSTLLEQIPGSTLTIVTSEREARERWISDQSTERNGTPASTSDVVQSALGSGQLHDRVQHVHYEGSGRKAAQVNYAASGLGQTGYVAVYDVDSRPSVSLLSGTLDGAEAYRDRTGELPAAIQQSARFVAAAGHPAAWQRFVCRGAATLQTLWTLRRELPSFRKYHAKARAGSGAVDVVRRGLAQTVGHGLLVRGDVLAQVGGFPTYTVLDDLPFGYRLSVLGIDVLPVPATTHVPAADGVAELVSQGRRWFHNYLDYPICVRQARVDGVGTSWSRTVAVTVGAYRGVTWLLRSPGAAATVLLVAPRVGRAARVAAASALLAGVVAPVGLLAHADGHQLSAKQLLIESLELLTANLFSSLGPAIAVIERARSGQPGTAISPRSRSRQLPHVLEERP